jgi:uncharacterized protein (TIGR03382 family)
MIHGFTVDTIPPEAPEVTAPGAFVSTQRPDIQGTAEASSRVAVWLDGEGPMTVLANAAGEWSFTPATALDEGPHQVQATATDAAGNVSPFSEARSFTINIITQRSHYGWSCATSPAFPATWALLALGLSLRRRRLRSR